MLSVAKKTNTELVFSFNLNDNITYLVTFIVLGSNIDSFWERFYDNEPADNISLKRFMFESDHIPYAEMYNEACNYFKKGGK